MRSRARKKRERKEFPRSRKEQGKEKKNCAVLSKQKERKIRQAEIRVVLTSRRIHGSEMFQGRDGGTLDDAHLAPGGKKELGGTTNAGKRMGEKGDRSKTRQNITSENRITAS